MKKDDFITGLLYLHSINRLGPKRIVRLVNAVEHPLDIFSMGIKKLQKIPGFNKQLIEPLLQKPNREFAETQYSLAEKNNISLTHIWADDYPLLLKEINDPPPLLWYKGTLQNISNTPIVIVGTRRPTLYGKKMTETICRELTAKGITVVSGLARGIDSIAHFTSVKHNGITIAVLAGGVDKIYPPENKKLVEKICRDGAVISEFPLGTKPEPGYFFRRNRIIAGLSKGVVVIEAGEKSGSLITATFALEYNRELFALPGPVTSPQSIGCLRLIQEGAKTVISTDDILSEFDQMSQQPKPQLSLKLLNEKQGKIYDLLSDDPVHIDKLVGLSGMTLNELNSILLDLELEGYVIQLSGKQFIKS